MKSKSVKLAITVSLLALTLGGCANFNSISRTQSIPAQNKSGRVVTVDAKQRHLLLSRDENGNLRTCAEAAPDVFSAFATSVSARGDSSGGQFGLSSAETAATIERTQTINMLRESFFRTCERYLSDAIDKNQFIIQAARDQRAMTTFLAIEQLTGALRPKSTILPPGGTAASVLSGEQAAKLIRDYDQRLEETKTAAEAAKQAVEDAADKECSTDTSNADANASECDALKLEQQEAEKAQMEAQEALDNITEIAKDLISAGTAGTTAGTSLQGGEVDTGSFNAATVAATGSFVVELVKLSNINEPLMFCLAHLNDRSRVGDSNLNRLTVGCLEILANQAARDQAKLAQNPDASLTQVRALAQALSLDAKREDFYSRLDQKIRSMDDNKILAQAKSLEEALIGVQNPVIFQNKCVNKVACMAAARASLDTFFERNQATINQKLDAWKPM